MANKNPKTKANTPTKIDLELLKSLYFEENMTQAEVAEKMGVSRKVIYNAMKRNGIKARTASKRDQKGSKNHMWKGGKIKDAKGYILVKCENHPRGHSNNGYVYEHVLIAEKRLGRNLHWFGMNDPKSEVVHHKNEIKTDNRIENLEVMTNSEHIKLHNRLRRERKNEKNESK